MLGSLGWQELVLIFAILGLLFGGSRIADLGGSLGRGVREFREGMSEDTAAEESPTADGNGAAIVADRAPAEETAEAEETS